MSKKLTMATTAKKKTGRKKTNKTKRKDTDTDIGLINSCEFIMNELLSWVAVSWESIF